MTRWSVEQLQQTEWFGPLRDQIRREVDRLSAQQQEGRPLVEDEKEEVSKQIQGWLLSLANPHLSPVVRGVVEADLDKALQRLQQIEQHLTEREAVQQQVQTVVHPEQVVDRLNHLAEVLAASNPSRGNLELSLHLEAIRCYKDGQVVVRTCKLGALPGAIELLANSGACPQEHATPDQPMVAKPRRRAVRRIQDAEGNQAELRAAAHRAADTERFAGLGPEWFWEDAIQIPRRLSWAKEHAKEVAQRRASGRTMEELASHFGKTVPTIRQALWHAKANAVSLEDLPTKMPRRRWEEDHAAEVARLRAEGKTLKELVSHFGKCAPTIRQALMYAAASGIALPGKRADQTNQA